VWWWWTPLELESSTRGVILSVELDTSVLSWYVTETAFGESRRGCFWAILAWPKLLISFTSSGLFKPFNLTTHLNSCQNLAHYSLPPPKYGWTAPNIHLGEGPIGRGAERPYCTDCIKCWNVLMDVPTILNNYVKYLVIEYTIVEMFPSQPK
jgi:hypothetical protein